LFFIVGIVGIVDIVGNFNGLIIVALNIFLLVIYTQKQIAATIQFVESLLRLIFHYQPDTVETAIENNFGRASDAKFLHLPFGKSM